MKLINPKFEIIEQQGGREGIYKQIELAGRTCYKSEHNITPISAKKFVVNMINSGHGAMLEHGTVYLDLPNPIIDYEAVEAYSMDKYSRISTAVDKDIVHNYVTTNLRVLVENDWLDDLKYLCEPTEYHEKRVCVRFTCDRGVSHEFVRHRVFSFAQESTRYCNYSSDRFGEEITCIIPSWSDLKEGYYGYEYEQSVSIHGGTPTVKEGYIYSKEQIKTEKDADRAEFINDKNTPFVHSLTTSESMYFYLLNEGWKPQQARQVLPNALKTELVMTGFISDWEHFFELRDDSHAHPDAQALAKPLHEEFIKRGYIK